MESKSALDSKYIVFEPCCLHALSPVSFRHTFRSVVEDSHRSRLSHLRSERSKNCVAYFLVFGLYLSGIGSFPEGGLFGLQFLSMRLAAVNPRVDFNLDSLFATEVSFPFLINLLKLGVT